jgi:hypothetical protein
MFRGVIMDEHEAEHKEWEKQKLIRSMMKLQRLLIRNGISVEVISSPPSIAVEVGDERLMLVLLAVDYSKVTGNDPRIVPPWEYKEEEDCCYGLPNMIKYPGGCPKCGCREAGNASFNCEKHKSVGM